MRQLIAIALSAVLAGCSWLSGVAPVNPPSAPSADDIQTSYNAVTTALPSLAAQDYVRAGYRKVDLNCDLFFDQLAQASRNYDFIRKETVLGISTASAMLALLHNTAQTLAILAVSGAALSQTLDNYEEYAILTKYTSQLQVVVSTKRTLYKQANPFTSVGTGDKFTADDYVRGYANLCTISALEADIADALSSTRPVLATPSPQYVTAVSARIQSDLHWQSAPTTSDLTDLWNLLADSATDKRKAVQKTDKFGGAIGVYWNANGSLVPQGLAIRTVLDGIVSSPAQPTTGDGQQPSAGAQQPGTLPPPPAAAPPPPPGGSGGAVGGQPVGGATMKGPGSSTLFQLVPK